MCSKIVVMSVLLLLIVLWGLSVKDFHGLAVFCVLNLLEKLGSPMVSVVKIKIWSRCFICGISFLLKEKINAF